MARTHIERELDTKLPREHLSVFTWVAIVAIVLTLVALAIWGIWIAEPNIYR